MNVSPRVAERIARDFGEDSSSHVIELLSSLDLRPSSAEADERITAAIVLVAAGDVDRLVHAAGLAEKDWRDVLVAAGLENEDWRDLLDESLPERPSNNLPIA